MVLVTTSVSWTDILTAIGTVGAVLISLGLIFYKEWWEPRWRRARLIISVDPVYSFAVDSSLEAISNEANEEMFTSGKVRLRVEHISGNPARNVEIFITKMWDIEFGKRKQRKNFFPTSILWSGKSEERIVKYDFAPNTIRFCDLGTYVCSWESNEWEFNVASSYFAGNPMVEKFSNILPAGTYELELLITGENVEPTTSRWHIKIDGDWSNKEEIMFSKHFQIKKI